MGDIQCGFPDYSFSKKCTHSTFEMKIEQNLDNYSSVMMGEGSGEVEGKGEGDNAKEI